MPAQRVAYILLWFPEPSQTFVLDEVNTLVHLGLEVQVFTLYSPRPAARVAGMAPVAAPVHSLGVKALGPVLASLRRLSRRWGPEAGPFLRRVLVRRWRTWNMAVESIWAVAAGVHLADLAEESGIGHLHAPWADFATTAAWVASQLTGIPFSFTARAKDVHPPDGALQEKMAAAALVRVDTLSNLRYLNQLTPHQAAKIVYLRTGLPMAIPVSPRRPQPGPPYRLLAVGRLVPKKGFSVLIEACRLLAHRGVDFHLTLAGDGRERRRLQNLVRKYGLENRVTFPGFVRHREIPRLCEQAHLLVMPCRIATTGDRDGIPHVILEAMAHEVPVVATEVSGIPEVVKPGETGWLVPPLNPQALAETIGLALADPAEARRLALAGRELVLRQFNSVENYAKLKHWFEIL